MDGCKCLLNITHVKKLILFETQCQSKVPSLLTTSYINSTAFHLLVKCVYFQQLDRFDARVRNNTNMSRCQAYLWASSVAFCTLLSPVVLHHTSQSASTAAVTSHPWLHFTCPQVSLPREKRTFWQPWEVPLFKMSVQYECLPRPNCLSFIPHSLSEYLLVTEADGTMEEHGAALQIYARPLDHSLRGWASGPMHSQLNSLRRWEQITRNLPRLEMA